MVEVPKDYVFSMFKELIDGRVDSLEKRIDYHVEDIKNSIIEMKKWMVEFQHVCNKTTQDQDDRIKELEQFKLKVYAYCSVVSITVTLIFSYINLHYHI